MDKSQHTSGYRKLTAALRKARETAGLTQAEVAAKLNVYDSFLSKVESGERRIDVIELIQLLKLYGVDVTAFLRTAGLIK